MKKRNIFLGAVLLIFMVLNPAFATKRMVMGEMFTNTSCPPCKPAGEALDEYVEDFGDTLAVIRYHTWWPSIGDPFYQANIAENRARIHYYGVGYVPYFRIDGLIEGGRFDIWDEQIRSRAQVSSPLSIVLDGNYNRNTRTGRIYARIKATERIPIGNLRLHFVLTESNIHWRAPNGKEYHNQVMRDMIPNAEGEPVVIASPGDTLLRYRDFVVDTKWKEEHCELVVFVQSNDNKEILQAAKCSVLALEAVGVKEAAMEFPKTFILYQNNPNPFSELTRISYQLPISSYVSLNIYDMMGRLIRILVDKEQNPGYYTIEWDRRDDYGERVPNGVYFCKLEAKGFIATKKLLVLQ